MTEMTLEKLAQLIAENDMTKAGIKVVKGGKAGITDTVTHLQTHDPVAGLVMTSDGSFAAQNGWKSRQRSSRYEN